MAVVRRALRDIEELRPDTMEYRQAVWFFAGAGHWEESRKMVAEMVDLHPDDLAKAGQRSLAVRAKKEQADGIGRRQNGGQTAG